MIVLRSAAIAAIVVAASGASASVRITEFMSEGQGLTGSGSGGNRQREFFEITNLGTSAVNVSNWSYNDNNTNDPINWGSQISSIAAGESIVFTQMSAADFRAYWNLSDSVRIVSYGQLSNLGNADTINIYSSSVQDATTLVDTLTYTADARGSGISRNRAWDGGDGALTNATWVDSTVGDIYGSRLAPNPIFPAGPEYIDLANPGQYVPSPGVLALGAGLMIFRGRRR